MDSLLSIKNHISQLNPTAIVDLQAFISQSIQSNATSIALAKRSEQIAQTGCLHCGFKAIQRYGRARSGTQRFRCGNCKTTFSATNCTPVYRLRNRHLWTKYLGLITQHIPLQALRDHHGFDRSLSTLHRWRHRFLDVLVANPEIKLGGVIEADEKFFRTAFKGTRLWKQHKYPQARFPRKRGGASQRGLGQEQVPVLTALDRSGAICQARLSNTKWDSVAEKMTPWIEADSVICSDGNGVYARIAAQIGCEHIFVKRSKGNASGLSIARVNAYHRDIENLVNRKCMGVSTRYLMNYFGWARRIAQHKPFGADLLGEMLMT